jgi:hypothetical protein
MAGRVRFPVFGWTKSVKENVMDYFDAPYCQTNRYWPRGWEGSFRIPCTSSLLSTHRQAYRVKLIRPNGLVSFGVGPSGSFLLGR